MQDHHRKAISDEFGIGPQRATDIVEHVARYDRAQNLLSADPGSKGLHTWRAGYRGSPGGMTLVDLL